MRQIDNSRLAKAVYHTDACPVQFSIWPVDVHKKDLVQIKGTGTQDLICLKAVSLDISWLVGLTDDL